MKESTIIRNLRRDLRRAEHDCAFLREERLAAMKDRDANRARATKAEQEAAEWKRRFDALLEKSVPVNAVSDLRLSAPVSPEEPRA